jgi:hypothetical protein
LRIEIMATRNSNRNSPPNRSPGHGSVPGNLIKLFATAKQAAPVIEAPIPTWSEVEVKALLMDLPQESKARFSIFVEQFAAMGSLMHCKIEALEASRVDLKGDQEALQSELLEASSMKVLSSTELEKARETLGEVNFQKEQLESQRKVQLVKEQELLIQEANIRGGLLSEREEALRTLREQVESIERKRNGIFDEVEAERQLILTQAKKEGSLELEKARAHRLELQAVEVELETRKLELDRREDRLRLNEELLKVARSSAVDAVRDQYEQELQDARSRVARLEVRNAKKSEECDRLADELHGLEELQSFAGGDVRGLVEESERLRKDCREKDKALHDANLRLATDDPVELKMQRDQYLEKMRQLDAELVSLRTQESNWHRSVTEREDWERARAAMERSRSVLHEQNDRLRRDVEELLDKKQAQTAFPALVLMDRDMRVPAHTEKVPELRQLVIDLQSRIAHSGGDGKVLRYSESDIQLFLGGLAMSQLHIFQGISGTGKTSLAMAFAKAVGGHCTVIPVQAGWRDRNDLLGYYNAFEKKYYERNALQALYRAQTQQWSDRVNIVLLDEMNLSRPEQYFAEFLSAMEMSEQDRLINILDSSPGGQMPELLRDNRDIRVPNNVWFIGTANQDETTATFADKTHDRAFVMELHKADEVGPVPPRQQNQACWSVSSLKSRFARASEVSAPQVEKLLGLINGSDLTSLLLNQWQLGWGNRFETQFKRFVPVVLAAGGSESIAVDHMLHSRMFREGKVVGRHDMVEGDLTQVTDELLKLWKLCELTGEPTRCLRALSRDQLRMERGG